MTISREDVEYVADLARLELTEPEIQEYTEQLNSILDYAAMLVDVDNDRVLFIPFIEEGLILFDD